MMSQFFSSKIAHGTKGQHGKKQLDRGNRNGTLLKSRGRARGIFFPRCTFTRKCMQFQQKMCTAAANPWCIIKN